MTQPTRALHLGVKLDASGAPTGERMELPTRELTTHGVIVGMTGSGKTGLGVVLLEEILSAGIPALVIDPKGDLGNLALRFPELRGEDFEPWVDPGQARQLGVSPGELAERTARDWRGGLERSGLAPDALSRFRDGVDVRVFTPGSSAGIPLDVLGSLAAPGLSWEVEGEALAEEVEGLASGLLLLAGIEGDPLTSREHILLANLIEHGWREGRDLDLALLLGWIQSPPLRRLGVFEIDAFFPAQERLALAMRLNGLVASPSFAAWRKGEPLDVDALLRGPDGRPRASVIHLAHLSDTERQFVVTLLLSRVVTWMRRQPGTSDLRALVYLDEVFGFAPPTAEPPSKRPMLTIFKQARAHGVGMVVATQNPVDLDYKLMSNAGTWMVGRLQTERDKARIVEALRSASGEVDTGRWAARIGALDKRQFVMKTAAAADPTLFTTRWAMSYLRGPLTLAEVGRLKEEGGSAGAAAPAAAVPAPGVAPGASPATPSLATDESPVAPAVAQGTRVVHLDEAAPWARELGVAPGTGRLEAGVAVRVRLVFDEERAGLRHEEEWEAVLFPLAVSPRAADARVVDYDDRDFRDAPEGEVVYALPEAPIGRADFFRALRRDFEEHLYRARTVRVLRNPALDLYARLEESEDAFRARCLRAAEDRADDEAAKLRDRVERKVEQARDRMAQAERRVRELEVDAGARRQQELVAGAGELLSMFMGGRRRTSSLAGLASRRSQTRRTQERLQSAAERLEDHEETLRDLEEELAEGIEEVWSRWKSVAGQIEPLDVSLEKNDISVDEIVLFWAPVSR